MGWMMEMFMTLFNFYAGITKLTVLLPFTIYRAWKLSMVYPHFLSEDQIYDDEVEEYGSGLDIEAKLALSDIGGDSSFEQEYSSPGGFFSGWYVDEERRREEENQENDEGLFSWLLGGDGRKQEEEEENNTKNSSGWSWGLDWTKGVAGQRGDTPNSLEEEQQPRLRRWERGVKEQGAQGSWSWSGEKSGWSWDWNWNQPQDEDSDSGRGGKHVTFRNSRSPSLSPFQPLSQPTLRYITPTGSPVFEPIQVEITASRLPDASFRIQGFRASQTSSPTNQSQTSSPTNQSQTSSPTNRSSPPRHAAASPTSRSRPTVRQPRSKPATPPIYTTTTPPPASIPVVSARAPVDHATPLSIPVGSARDDRDTTLEVHKEDVVVAPAKPSAKVSTLIDQWNQHVIEKEAKKLSFKVAKRLSPKISRKFSPRSSFSRSPRLSPSPRSSWRYSPRSSQRRKAASRPKLTDLANHFQNKIADVLPDDGPSNATRDLSVTASSNIKPSRIPLATISSLNRVFEDRREVLSVSKLKEQFEEAIRTKNLSESRISAVDADTTNDVGQAAVDVADCGQQFAVDAVENQLLTVDITDHQLSAVEVAENQPSTLDVAENLLSTLDVAENQQFAVEVANSAKPLETIQHIPAAVPTTVVAADQDENAPTTEELADFIMTVEAPIEVLPSILPGDTQPTPSLSKKGKRLSDREPPHIETNKGEPTGDQPCEELTQVLLDNRKPAGSKIERRIRNLSKIKSRIFPKKELSFFQKNISTSMESLLVEEPQTASLYRSISKVSLSSGLDGFKSYKSQGLYSSKAASRSGYILDLDPDQDFGCQLNVEEVLEDNTGSPEETRREFISGLFKEKVLRDFWRITRREEAYLRDRTSDSE